MNSFTRIVSFILAMALVAPFAAYPALADDATSTPPVADAGTATTTDTTTVDAAPDASSSDSSATTTDAAPDTVADTSATTTDTGAATESATSTSSSAATTTEEAVDDASSASSASATSTETDTTVSETTSGGGGGEGAAEAAATTTDATTTPDLPATAPLAGLSTTTDSTLGTTTATGPEPDLASTTTATDSPSIVTGDATAGANIVNVADSNFVNSSGEIVLSNYFTPVAGIDLRSATSTFSTGVLCLLFSCTGSGGVTLNLDASSSLENLLVLNATSGGNMIEGTGTGTASILTGNAFAGVNLVNLANLNVLNSTYFLAALNAFEGITGDIVFPGLTGFFGASLSGAAPGSIALDSNAVVDNQLSLTADTGGNNTDATSSVVSTGDTRTFGTLLNDLNGTTIGGANLAVLLRVPAGWNGQIYSAPAGLSVIRGDDGSILLLKDSDIPALAADAALAATSTARIVNHIDLGAFTGDNGIFGVDAAHIATGDAFVGANVLNLANQNIVGRNWLTAVINVFGNFTGNIAFGRPDLWVGEQVEAPARIAPGTDVVFHFTVTNKGDAPATNATFAASLDPAHLSITDGQASSDLGTLAPGASADVTIHARVTGGAGDIPTSGTAGETEPDNNGADNTDSVTLHMAQNSGHGGSLVSHSFGATELPFVVTRATAAAVVSAGNRTVHEELSVENPNDATSSPIDLHDLLKDPDGMVIEDQAWPLDTLAPHEDVTVAYDLVFKDDTPAGRYMLSTVLVGADGDTEYKDNGSILIAGVVQAAHAVRGPAPLSTPPTITRQIATSTPSAPALPAAALLAPIPWTYALGFVMAAAALAGVLYAAVILRRRHLP